MLSAVPSHLDALLRAPSTATESLQPSKIVTAGARLDPALRGRLAERWPSAKVYTCYGQTEGAPRILCCRSDQAGYAEGYTGYLVGDWKARLSSEGDLEVQGPQRMIGYLGEDAQPFSVDGWLRSGDQAEIFPNGCIWIKGRRDDLVKIAGERVSTVEIEQAVTQLTGIREAAVIAIDQPTPSGFPETTLVAAVVFEEGRARPSLELVRELKTHLPAPKIPKRFVVLDRLPRSAQNKLLRKELRTEVESRLARKEPA